MEPQPSRDPLNAAAHVYTRVRLALNAARRWPRNTARKFLGALSHAFRSGVCKAGSLLMVAKLVRLLTSSMVTVRRAGRSRKPSGLPRSGPGGDERAAPPPPTGRLALCGAVSRLSDRTTRLSASQYQSLRHSGLTLWPCRTLGRAVIAKLRPTLASRWGRQWLRTCGSATRRAGSGLRYGLGPRGLFVIGGCAETAGPDHDVTCVRKPKCCNPTAAASSRGGLPARVAQTPE